MTPTDEQVEAVAKALYDVEKEDDYRSWEDQFEFIKECYRQSARAAIAAMQPTVAQAAEVLAEEINRCRGKKWVLRTDTEERTAHLDHSLFRALTEPQQEDAT